MEETVVSRILYHTLHDPPDALFQRSVRFPAHWINHSSPHPHSAQNYSLLVIEPYVIAMPFAFSKAFTVSAISLQQKE